MPKLLKFTVFFLFYTYIGLVLLAGFWGAFINPSFDFKFLMDLRFSDLKEEVYINLTSQYRFLRALEFGFGLYSFVFTKSIFAKGAHNQLFLTIMASGILARLVSIIAEGRPNNLFLFFIGYELVGWIAIFIYTRKKLV